MLTFWAILISTDDSPLTIERRNTSYSELVKTSEYLGEICDNKSCFFLPTTSHLLHLSVNMQWPHLGLSGTLRRLFCENIFSGFWLFLIFYCRCTTIDFGLKCQILWIKWILKTLNINTLVIEFPVIFVFTVLFVFKCY